MTKRWSSTRRDPSVTKRAASKRARRAPSLWPSRKATPRMVFLALCEKHELEVDHTHRGRCHHVHVQAPAGKRFSGLRVDNLGVWDNDDGTPDWELCRLDVEGALPLEDDPDAED